MGTIIIAETTGSDLHPVTAQLVTVTYDPEGNVSNDVAIICPGGVGASAAAKIAGVSKVISVEGDCFSSFDGAAWAAAMSGLTSDGRVILAATPRGRELAAHIATSRNIPVIQDVTGGSYRLIMYRPVYSGKAIERSKFSDCFLALFVKNDVFFD